MIFEILLAVSVFVYAASWIHRYIVLEDMYRPRTENEVKETKRKLYDKKLIAFHFVLSFVLMPVLLVFSKMEATAGTRFLFAMIWCAGNVFVEIIWEKLINALEDRANLVLWKREKELK